MISETRNQTRTTGIQTQQGWKLGAPLIKVALKFMGYVTKYQTKTTGIQTQKGWQTGAPLINVALILYDFQTRTTGI